MDEERVGDLVGYARVSSEDQDLTIQIDQLRAAGCDRIFKDKFTGTTTAGRDGLGEALEYLRPGDVLVITRLDRLARSLADLIRIIQEIADRGAQVRCLFQPIDTTTAEGRLFMAMIGAFAEFETEIRKARQREGIEAAKAKGVYRGRARKAKPDEIIPMLERGMTVDEVAAEVGVHKYSIQRAVRGIWSPGMAR